MYETVVAIFVILGILIGVSIWAGFGNGEHIEGRVSDTVYDGKNKSCVVTLGEDSRDREAGDKVVINNDSCKTAIGSHVIVEQTNNGVLWKIVGVR